MSVSPQLNHEILQLILDFIGTEFPKRIYQGISKNISIAEIITHSKIQIKIAEKNLILNIYPIISRIAHKGKAHLKDSIGQLIHNDLSNVVAGTYCSQNIESRPMNFFISIENLKEERMEILFNIMPQKQIIILSNLICEEQTPSAILFFKQLIIHFQNCFIFGSGKIASKFLQMVFPNDLKLNNIVYILRNSQNSQKTALKQVKIKTLVINEDFIEKMNESAESIDQWKRFCKFYEYTDTDIKLQERINNNYHVIGIFKNQIVGGARFNDVDHQYAIVGGVKVLKDFRNQGFGTKICITLVKSYQDKPQEIVLDTDKGNFPARKIYEDMGFVPIGESIFIDNGSGVVKGIIADRDYYR
jgi:predicted GNAT family acetyltransferase